MKPQYQNSIVNLVNSIRKAGDSSTYYQPLGALPPAELGDGCVLILIDGLASRFIEGTTMETQRRADINSVFPSETAACLPTYNTGLAPAEHGITGWYMYAKELGSVITTLPMSLKAEELYFSHDAVEAMFDHSTLYEEVSFDCHIITTEELTESAYSQCHYSGATLHPVDDLSTFFERIEELAQAGRYVHAYWPDLDATLHEYGIGEESKEIVEEIDEELEELTTPVPTVVTADHGMTEAQPIQLEDYPEIRDTLLLPTTGMSRTVYCHVKHERGAEFVSLVEEKLGHACDVKESEELLENGYFGTNQRHPRIEERIGDYTLLMEDNYALYEATDPFQGVHGGLSEEEMHVPLIVV